MGTPPIEPSEFDLIVIGTGLVEAIVAAAAAKAGKSVLQVDPNSHYGSAWASLRLDEFLRVMGVGTALGLEAAPAVDLDLGISSCEVLSRPGVDLGPARDYSIDLAPKTALGAGPLVALLIGSGAHNYIEFKLVQGVRLLRGGDLSLVPATRAQVFRDRVLSLSQKRALMRFLRSCQNALEGQGPLAAWAVDHLPEEEEASRDGTVSAPPPSFAEVMEQAGLDDADLQKLVLHGVLFSDAPGPSAPAAFAFLRRYIESVGRYGVDAGPLLTPVYGCGELPQAFCRVAAVGGAVQVLRCPVARVLLDEDNEANSPKCHSVELGSGQVVGCAALASGAAGLRGVLAAYEPPEASSVISTCRCVAVLDRPLVVDEQQTLVAMPPGAFGERQLHPVWGLALGCSTAACPPGKWLLHLWTREEEGASDDARDALQAALDFLVVSSGLDLLRRGEQDEEASPDGLQDNTDAEVSEPTTAGKPNVLLVAKYRMRSYVSQPSRAREAPGWPANVALCPGPDPSVTFFQGVEAAKACYSRLYPTQPGTAAAAFPLDPRSMPEEDGLAEADAASDDEAIEALRAALAVADPSAAAGASDPMPQREGGHSGGGWGDGR